MKLNDFIKELEKALVERGVSEELSKKHVANLYRSFTTDDLSEIESIESNDEVAALADSISLILNKKSQAVASKNEPAVKENTLTRITPDPTGHDRESNNLKLIKTQEQQTTRIKKLYTEPEFGSNDEYSESQSSSRGVTIFWIGLFVTLPITLSLLAVIFGAFAAAFASLIGIIIASVAVLIVLVALGAAVSLVGIIYGITQLFSFPAAGIYEIGLGVIVAGAVLFVSILIYNFAIRFVPWVISKLGVFLKYVCGKLVTLFNFARKECYKL